MKKRRDRFKGGTPEGRQKLNQLLTDLEDAEQEIAKLKKALQGGKSPMRFIVCENGFPSAFIIDARREALPGVEA